MTPSQSRSAHLCRRRRRRRPRRGRWAQGECARRVRRAAAANPLRCRDWARARTRRPRAPRTHVCVCVCARGPPEPVLKRRVCGLVLLAEDEPHKVLVAHLAGHAAAELARRLCVRACARARVCVCVTKKRVRVCVCARVCVAMWCTWACACAGASAHGRLMATHQRHALTHTPPPPPAPRPPRPKRVRAAAHLLKDAAHDLVCERAVVVAREVGLVQREVVVAVELPKLAVDDVKVLVAGGRARACGWGARERWQLWDTRRVQHARASSARPPEASLRCAPTHTHTHARTHART
jgi:hypothetical protein